MSKTIIIPDIHLRHLIAEKIISSETPDQIIFLGDYFDDFGDTLTMVGETASWLQWSVKQPNRIHLCGNHDIAYWFPDNHHLRCSGYARDKAKLINNIISQDDWSRLEFYCVLDKWLLSHAGLHPYFVSSKKFKEKTLFSASLSEVTDMLDLESKNIKKMLGNGKSHWFIRAGHSRGGSQSYGGLTWCDWNDEFFPIRGIHQIVGHTSLRKTYWRVVNEDENRPSLQHELKTYDEFPIETLKSQTPNDKNSYNVCLDTRPGLQLYGVYENQQISIKQSLL